MRAGFWNHRFLIFITIASASPALGFADESARFECVKTTLRKAMGVVASVRELPKKMKDGAIQWGREVKEQGPIRLVLAPAPSPPWFGLMDLRDRPILRNAYWALSPVYAASGYKKTLAFLPATALGLYGWGKYDSAVEKRELENVAHLYPKVPGGEYAYTMLGTGVYSPSDIKARLKEHQETLRAWTEVHDQAATSRTFKMLPRMRELMARGTIKSAQEAAALDRIAYEAYLAVVNEVQSSDAQSKETLNNASGVLIDKEFSARLLRAPEFKNRSEHDLLLLLTLLSPSFEVGGLKDIDLYDLMLESQTHQRALATSAARAKFKKEESGARTVFSLATQVSPGNLLSVYASTLHDKKGIQAKMREGVFLPESKRYLAQRADVSEFSSPSLVNDGGAAPQRFQNELDRWRYLMTSSQVTDVKDSWLKGEMNDVEALRQLEARLQGMNDFYGLLAKGIKPEPATLCSVIGSSETSANAVFTTAIFYSKDAAKFRKLSQSDTARCVQEASLLNWKYWSERKGASDAFINDLQALINRCPEDRSAPVLPCLQTQ